MTQKKKPATLAGLAVVLVLALAGSYFGVDLLGSEGGAGGRSGTLTGNGPSETAGGAESRTRSDARGGAATGRAVDDDASVILRAMRNKQSEVMATLVAEVVAVLPDDNEGSRHQRFLLGFEEPGAPYDSVLVAHNIDLAPRVPLEKGDTVTVRGQYEFNDKGGVLHWTHHDPKDWREGGWIELDGERYE